MAEARMATYPNVLPAKKTVIGSKVFNQQNEDLGKIEDLVIDAEAGRIAYAVLSFGGFLGMGDKFFAVPWSALKLDTENHRFVLNVTKEALKDAPGFDKDHWPTMADPTWAQGGRRF